MLCLLLLCFIFLFFFFNDTATTEIYTLSLHDALPIRVWHAALVGPVGFRSAPIDDRSEEHTSELQSRPHLVCRLLLEKKKKNRSKRTHKNKQKDKKDTKHKIQTQ